MEENKEEKSSIKDIAKFLIKGTIFCIIALAILYLLGPIFTPKWYNKVYEGSTRRMKGIYDEPKDTIDIVIAGNSDVYNAISTMKLWNDMGISSYHIGTPRQNVPISYYVLKNFLDVQSPKIAVIDMDFAFEGKGYKKYIRRSIDDMPLNSNKIKMINDPVFKNSIKTKISYIFPLLRFHSRWDEISLEEIKQTYEKKNINFKGYEYSNDVEPYKGKKKNKEETYRITEETKEYLDKILELCKQNNIQVILIYAPAIKSWNQSKHDECSQYAEERNLTFIDYNLSEFDWKKYTKDRGYHLNTEGAEIITQKLEETLKQYNLPDHRSEEKYKQWNENYKVYENLKNNRSKNV